MSTTNQSTPTPTTRKTNEERDQLQRLNEAVKTLGRQELKLYSEHIAAIGAEASRDHEHKIRIVEWIATTYPLAVDRKRKVGKSRG